MSTMTANILVIDDEVGMREGCRRALTPQGFQVDVAEHGVEGLRKLRESHYDLVLLDAMMPGMSGLELLERIQESDPSIICIMITGPMPLCRYDSKTIVSTHHAVVLSIFPNLIWTGIAPVKPAMEPFSL